MKKIYTIIIANPSDICATNSFTSKKDAELEFGRVRCDLMQLIIDCKMTVEFIANGDAFFSFKEKGNNNEYSAILDENWLNISEEK